MANPQGGPSRLRRPFHYPDSDDDSQPEAIDEQEQESLITRLSDENASRNALFRLILLPIPFLATIPYLIHGPFSSRPLLAITSLLSTAYLVYALPPESTGIPRLDALVQPAKVRSQNALRDRRAAAAPFTNPTSPLDVYLPYLNIALCALVLLAGWVASTKAPHEKHYSFIGLDSLPALVYGAVLVAKLIMGSVDPEGELRGLTYEYKGA